MKYVLVSVIGTVLVGSAFMFSGNDENQNTKSAQEIVEKIKKGKEEAVKVLKEFKDERGQLINALTLIISDKSMQEKEKLTVLEAVNMIGLLRAPEAIDVLKDNLLFEPYEDQERIT